MAMNREQARLNMLEQQVRPWDVLDQRVLDAMAQIPREAFVAEALRGLAFSDSMLPLDEGAQMMEPKLVGRMLQALALEPGDKVLEIGTGNGYVTALLASLAGRVVSVEISPALHEQARQQLAALSVTGVELVLGNGAAGWGGHQAFDAIAVTGSLPEIGNELKESLRVGGRLFAVVGEGLPMEARLLTRLGQTSWRETVLFETSLPPLQGLPSRASFVF